MVTGTPAAGALPVQDPDAHLGDLRGHRRRGVPSASLGRFPHGRPRHPSPGHWARGDPELEKTPRQAPRPGAASERQESVKEARSPSAKTASSAATPAPPPTASSAAALSSAQSLAAGTAVSWGADGGLVAGTPLAQAWDSL